MINTTKFLDALRSFEHIAKQNDIKTSLKIPVKRHLLNELRKLENEMRDVDLGDEIEVIKGTNEALKNL